MYEQKSTWQADSSVTQGIFVYRERTRTLLLVGMMWLFLFFIGGGLLSSWLQDANAWSSVPVPLVLGGLVLGFVGVGLSNVYVALGPQPYVIINDEGIRITSLFTGGEFIPWSQISALSVERGRSGGHFRIVYSKGVFQLRALHSSIPPKELLTQIVQRYGHELHTYHVEV